MRNYLNGEENNYLKEQITFVYEINLLQYELCVHSFVFDYLQDDI